MEIKTYSDYCKIIKGQTSISLQDQYDKKYFTSHVGGAENSKKYFEGKGLVKTKYTEYPLVLADIHEGDKVLDVGCGRGEIVFQCAAMGAEATGIDYSASAIEIANTIKEMHKEENPQIFRNAEFRCVNAMEKIGPNRQYDKVFLLDVIEHVSCEELQVILRNIRSVLKNDGKLVIHSTPNRWTRTYGYYMRVIADIIRFRKIPQHPIVQNYNEIKNNPDYDVDKLFLHINEMTVMSLKKALKKSGYCSDVWLQDSRDRWDNVVNKNMNLKDIIKAYVMKYMLLELFLDSNLYALAKINRNEINI